MIHDGENGFIAEGVSEAFAASVDHMPKDIQGWGTPQIYPFWASGQAYSAMSFPSIVGFAVFMLLPTRLAASLADYLAGGGRKIDTWYGRLRLAVADLSDRPETFVNVNDPTERERVEKQLSKPAKG